VASKCRVGDCGKGRARLVSPKAVVQPLELLLPVLQSLQATNQMHWSMAMTWQCDIHMTCM